MEISQLIDPSRVVVGLRAGNKAEVLREVARRAAGILGLDVDTIDSALTAREALGSTGLGQGLALPHARIEGLTQFFGLFARLDHGIDFTAIDEQPVDLVFLLLMPSRADPAHLAALAAVSRRLRDRAVTQRLRAAKDSSEAYALLTSRS